MSVSDFIYDVSQHHGSDEHTLTVTLDDEEEFFITATGRVLHDGEPVVYPYLRLGIARYKTMRDNDWL